MTDSYPAGYFSFFLRDCERCHTPSLKKKLVGFPVTFFTTSPLLRESPLRKSTRVFPSTTSQYRIGKIGSFNSTNEKKLKLTNFSPTFKIIV